MTTESATILERTRDEIKKASGIILRLFMLDMRKSQNKRSAFVSLQGHLYHVK